MTGTTPNEGYPYPLESDFADVQDAYRLATAIDSDLRSEQAPFRALLGRPSFIGLQTATQSGATNLQQVLLVQSVEWDNTGGLVVGSGVWTQPLSQPPSWWMFGATIRVNPTGTPVSGDLNMGGIVVQTADQVTGQLSLKSFYQRNDDSVTGGEWINLFTMAPIYHGAAECLYIADGSTAKGILAGSRFWGICLGPVT